MRVHLDRSMFLKGKKASAPFWKVLRSHRTAIEVAYTRSTPTTLGLLPPDPGRPKSDHVAVDTETAQRPPLRPAPLTVKAPWWVSAQSHTKHPAHCALKGLLHLSYRHLDASRLLRVLSLNNGTGTAGEGGAGRGKTGTRLSMRPRPKWGQGSTIHGEECTQIMRTIYHICSQGVDCECFRTIQLYQHSCQSSS